MGIDTVRRTTEEKRSRNYKSCNSVKVNVKSLSDDDSCDEEENISENRDGEGYLFFLIPSKIKKFFGSGAVHNYVMLHFNFLSKYSVFSYPLTSNVLS